MYEKFDRIELVSTTDMFTQLHPGDKGTVTHVDDLGTVHINWDNGSSLGMIPDEDTIKKISN